MPKTDKPKIQKTKIQTIRERVMQRKYENTKGKPLGMRLNDYIGHKKHDEKIMNLVEKYLKRPMTVRRRWKKNKYIITPSNSPILVNKNETKKAKGELYKRRPMSQKRSSVIRNSMINSPRQYNLWRPGVVYNKHEIYENPNFPNPYIK